MDSEEDCLLNCEGKGQRFPIKSEILNSQAQTKISKRRPGGDVYNLCCALYDGYERVMRAKSTKLDTSETTVEHPIHIQDSSNGINQRDWEDCNK